MRQPNINGSGSFLIFVDLCDSGICSGRYISHCLGEYGSFGSFDQLLLKLEKCMDTNNDPQAFQKIRYFCPAVSSFSDRDICADTRQGRLASFSLNIRFRRNASWQGTLRWLDRTQSESFRSALELLRLLDSAISGADFQELNLMEG